MFDTAPPRLLAFERRDIALSVALRMPNHSSGNSSTPSNVFGADASATAIELRNVSYSLPNGRSLLHDLNLTVKSGETLVLLGRRGAGKPPPLNLLTRMWKF